MRLLLIIIAVLFLSSPAPGLAQDNAGQEQRTYTVILNNTCSQDIKVAIHYRDPALGWVTRGWWYVPGKSEVHTGLKAGHYQFYMHGETGSRKQWPPARSKKQYEHFDVRDGEDFLLTPGGDRATTGAARAVPFSLKEISPDSPGLKARFDC